MSVSPPRNLRTKLAPCHQTTTLGESALKPWQQSCWNQTIPRCRSLNAMVRRIARAATTRDASTVRLNQCSAWTGACLFFLFPRKRSTLHANMCVSATPTRIRCVLSIMGRTTGTKNIWKHSDQHEPQRRQTGTNYPNINLNNGPKHCRPLIPCRIARASQVCQRM